MPENKPGRFSEETKEIVGLFLQGGSLLDVENYIKARWPKKDARVMARKALEYFALVASEPAESLYGFCLAGLRDMYRQLVNVGDFAGAVRALQELAKITERVEELHAAKPRDHSADAKVALMKRIGA